MGKKRHLVTVKLLPYGSIQHVAIVPDWGRFCNLGQPESGIKTNFQLLWAPQFARFDNAPSVFTDLVLQPEERVSEAQLHENKFLEEGGHIHDEHCTEHWCVSGTLTETLGAVIVPSSPRHIYLPNDVSVLQSGLLLQHLLPNGSLEDTAETWAVGMPKTQTNQPYRHDGALAPVYVGSFSYNETAPGKDFGEQDGDRVYAYFEEGTFYYRYWHPDNPELNYWCKAVLSVPDVLDYSAATPREVCQAGFRWTWKKQTGSGPVIEGIDPAYQYEPWATGVTGLSPLYDNTSDRRRNRIANDLELSLKATSQMLKGFTNAEGNFLACRNAIEAFQLTDINGIAYVKDLAAIGKLVDPIVKLIAKPFSPKAWASLLLWYRYGVKLSYRDSVELVKALWHVKKLCKAFQNYSKYRNSTKCYYGRYTEEYHDPESLQLPDDLEWVSLRTHYYSRVTARWEDSTPGKGIESLARLAEDLDFKLNLENMWDLVPFSFVLDWFVNFGEMFSRMDFQVILDQLSLREAIISSKVIAKSPPGLYFKSHGLFGELEFKKYSRVISPTFPPVPVRLDSSLTFLTHWYEGLLLFLSMKGK